MSGQEQGQPFRVVCFWNSEKRSEVDDASLEKLGQNKPSPLRTAKRRRLENPAVEGIVGVIASPVRFRAVVHEFPRYTDYFLGSDVV